jgi:hypothetical protein
VDVRWMTGFLDSPTADLACDDVPAEVARQVGLGAQVVREVPGDWTTLRDPAGREYCVTARSPFADFVGAA